MLTGSPTAGVLYPWWTSIFWHSVIDLVGPGRYPALQVLDSFKSSLLKHPVGIRAAATHGVL